MNKKGSKFYNVSLNTYYPENNRIDKDKIINDISLKFNVNKDIVKDIIRKEELFIVEHIRSFNEKTYCLGKILKFKPNTYNVKKRRRLLENKS